jgi:uncharacterized integral membrane protein (TIGR00697 family)
MNELLFVAMLLSALVFSLISFRLGKEFLYAYLAMIATFAIFLGPMVIVLFGFPFFIGEVFYAAIFLSTDMTTERWGETEARHILWLVILIFVVVSVLMQFALLLTPHSSDFVQGHIRAALAVTPRLIAAGFVMFLIEQHFDIWFFGFLKRKFQGKHLWLRNNISTMTSQLIDVLGVYPLALYGVYPNLVQLMIAAYLFKICMAVLDTPFMYLSKRVQ